MRKMGPSRLALWLVVATVLGVTWARAFSEVPAEVGRRHWRKIGDGSIVDRSKEYHREIVRRYLEDRGESTREGVRSNDRKSRSLGGSEENRGIPYSARRWQKMLDKAIFKIIMGDLSTADILLLKSLNYDLEEISAIRERELARKIGVSERTIGKIVGDYSTVNYVSNYLEDNENSSKEIVSSTVTSSTIGGTKNRLENADDDFDFEAYNRQAVYDYENAANNASQQTEHEPIAPIADLDTDLRKSFDRAMESHVVFKIRYDDSEFDSRSDERSRQISMERAFGSVGESRLGSFGGTNESAKNAATKNRLNDTFLESRDDLGFSMPLPYRSSSMEGQTEPIEATTIDRVVDDRNDSRSVKSATESAEESVSDERTENRLVKNDFSNGSAGTNVYEGLEWVEDDVYRVIPEATDSFDYDGNAIYLDKATIEDGNETRGIGIDSRSGEDDRNDTSNYQNEDSSDFDHQQGTANSSVTNRSNADLSPYQQLAIAHRRDSNLTSAFDSQGQKAIEDIKLKVLAMTGRFNLSSSSNQVQRERLTLFSPICQAPRNTDPEAWADPFSMNMYFQLNLTSGDHVVAAKLRIYKLPQNNLTLPNSAAAEEEDEEEKKIRISVYFYTKSLKKHRSKKRLMDSVVTALTTEGNHLALDVRQAIRFWRQHLRNSHGSSNNHGLVIQVEDQDGRPLKPSQYIELDTCHDTERTEDDKAYQRVPALFIQACSRYVRVVNGEAVVYVNCSKSSRNGRH